jgi:hypothetical protein
MPENGRLAQVATAVHLVGQYLGYLFVALRIAGVLRHAAFMRDSFVGPDAAGASLAGLGDDESEAGLEELQNFGEASRGSQPLPSTLNNKLGRARRLDHAVSW